MPGKREKLNVNLNLNVRGLAPSATLAINEKSNEMIRQGRTVYKLGLGQSPFPVPEQVVEALKINANKKDYLPVKGLPELREAVSGFKYRYQKIKSSPEDVIIGPGSKELIFILQLVYYGDLIIPTPSWVSYSPQARIIGRNVNWVPTSPDNNWRLSPERLELICRSDPDRPRIVILNYPANPTGCTYPRDRLKKLAEVARRYRVVLISDEIYGLLHHKDRHQSIAHYYPEGTIISSGLSKWCGAGGWRLGTFIFPRELRWLLDAMASVASETFTATSAPIQYAAITAFNGSPEIEQYLFHSRRILRGIASVLVEMMRDMGAELPVPDGAFYLFPDFGKHREMLNRRGIYTSSELCSALLEETGVALLPGLDFGMPPEILTARIAYVDFDGPEVLRKAWQESPEGELGKAFVKENCPRLIEAFEKMGTWFSDMPG